MKRFLVLVGTITTFGILGSATPSLALPITYTLTTTATGTLGGTPFTNAFVTMTLLGDTDNILQPYPDVLPDFLINPGTATITIASLGTATFNDPNGYAAFLFPVIPDEVPIPSFAILQFDEPNMGGGTGILGIGSNSLAGYDLASALGPLVAAGGGVATNPDGSPVFFSTNRGGLFLTGAGENSALTVTPVRSVPEPSSLSLLGAGGFAL